MALLLHYTGQDYTSRGLLNTELTPGSTSAFANGCKTGKGFAFDNTANSSLSGNLALNHVEFSLSCWFKITTTPPVGGRNVIFATNPTVNNRIILDVNDNNIMRFVVFYGSSFKIVLGGTASLNVWYHVAATCDDSNKIIRIFVNGILIGQESYTGVLNPCTIFNVGKRDGANQYFNGQICNFKYYNHVLSAREIAEDYKSLMLHYKLDKPITTQVFDHSGFNRHITNLTYNTVTLDSNSQVYSASLKNDGTQALMGTCDLTDLNGLDEFTISYWQMPYGTGYKFVLSNNKTYSDHLTTYFKFLHHKNGTALVQFFFCGIYREITVPAWIPNRWYRITLTKTPTHIRAYINKTLIHTIGTTNQISNFTDKLVISSGYSGSNFYNMLNGNVQDIRFYAKALTQAEVTELYQTRHMVDKDSNCYTYELIEGQTKVGMNKQGQLLCDEIIENEDGTFQIVSNKKIKTKEIKEI